MPEFLECIPSGGITELQGMDVSNFLEDARLFAEKAVSAAFHQQHTSVEIGCFSYC